MTREIKFRGWNQYKKFMTLPFTFMDDLYWYQDDAPAYEIMQYTGLKDKNGVEIYEGDILSDKSVVKFEVDSRDVDGWMISGYWWGEMEEKNIEVIGNIYENPELINKHE